MLTNTFALEHLMGWSGILIEPGPENFARLLRNRPDNVLINAAICGTPQARRSVSPAPPPPAASPPLSPCPGPAHRPTQPHPP